MNAQAIESTDAQWGALYEAHARAYRLQAAAYRAQAEAELLHPVPTPGAQVRIDSLLALADDYERMAREQTEGGE